jgi:hypothetical protein
MNATAHQIIGWFPCNWVSSLDVLKSAHIALKVGHETVSVATNLKRLFVALLSPHETILVLGHVNLKRIQPVGPVTGPTPDLLARCPGAS